MLNSLVFQGIVSSWPFMSKLAISLISLCSCQCLYPTLVVKYVFRTEPVGYFMVPTVSSHSCWIPYFHSRSLPIYNPFLFGVATVVLFPHYKSFYNKSFYDKERERLWSQRIKKALYIGNEWLWIFRWIFHIQFRCITWLWWVFFFLMGRPGPWGQSQATLKLELAENHPVGLLYLSWVIGVLWYIRVLGVWVARP